MSRDILPATTVQEAQWACAGGDKRRGALRESRNAAAAGNIHIGDTMAFSVRYMAMASPYGEQCPLVVPSVAEK